MPRRLTHPLAQCTRALDIHVVKYRRTQMQLPRLDEVVDAQVDDYYSPIKPEDYIELRLMPAIEFYQKRVPVKTHHRMAFKLSLLAATVASSVLARYQLNHFVTVVTAFSSVIISYSEFADADRKVER